MPNEVKNIGYSEQYYRAKELGIRFQPLIFAGHMIKNGGLLPDEIGASACWYYCRNAHIALQQVADGAVYEGELDHVNMLNNIARSVAVMYDFKGGPAEFLKFLIPVRMEAMRLQMTWDSRVESPLNYDHRARTN